MRFMMYSLANKDSEAGVQLSPEQMAEMGKFMMEVAQSGALVSGGGCMPSSNGAHIRNSGGQITVTDGPFAETKEIIGGWAIVDVKSLAEAVEWSTRFFKVAGEGEGYILRMHDEPQ